MTAVERAARRVLTASHTPGAGSAGPILAGCLGSLTLAVAAWLVGPLGRATDLSARSDLAVRQVGQVAFFLGMAVLCLAWARLVRRAVRSTLGRRDLGWAATLWAAPLLLSPPLGSRDVYSYLAQGHLVASGLNPYETAPRQGSATLLEGVSTSWTETTSPYGPVFSLLTGGVTAVAGESYIGGLVLLRVLVAASYVLAIWLLARILKGDPSLVPAAVCLVALNPLLLVHGLSGLHNEMLLLPALAAAVLAARSSRFVVVGLLVALAAGCKVTAVAVLPFLLMLPAWPGFWPYVRRGVVATVTAAVALVTAGWLGGFGVSWLLAPVDSAARGSRLSLSTTAADLAEAVLPEAVDVRQVVTLGFLLVAAAVVLWLLLRRREPLLSAGLAAAVVAASGPLLHPWYFLPALLFLGLRSDRRAVVPAVVAVTLGLALLVRPEGGEIFKGTGPLVIGCVLLGYVLLAVDAWWARRAAAGAGAGAASPTASNARW
jgi:alpha-1,6-mannosyltransferase